MPTKKTAPKSKKTKSKSTETIKTTGDQLLRKIKDLIHQGNIRKISIIDKKGKTILVIPVTLGVIGVAFAPVLAAIGAIAAFVTECTIKVEKKQ